MTNTSTENVVLNKPTKKESPFANFFKRLFKEKPMGAIGAIFVLVMLIAGIFANFLAPYGMNEMHPYDALKPPSIHYVFGTDNLGRDVFSRVIYGARVSLIIGLTATALSTLLGALIGLTSGYIGGKFDLLIQRFVDAWMCFPSLILYLTLMAVIGAGLVQLILVLGIGYGITGSRWSRALTFWVKENVFFEASRAIGCRTWQVIIHHLLPSILPMLIVSFSMGIGGIILAEASLSFLGFGLPPDVASWGGMLSGSNRSYMEQGPWLVIFPGLALTVAVWGINMLGDAVRDILDPRLRGGIGGMGERAGIMAKKALEKKLKRAVKLEVVK